MDGFDGIPELLKEAVRVAEDAASTSMRASTTKK
jgi:hypothetical protein